jgi:response regulator RpfG family c-di-GMP phosphodiesterase
VLGALPAAGIVACGLAGVLAAMAVFLVLAPFCQRDSHERTKAERDALEQLNSLMRMRDALIFGLAEVSEFRDPAIGRHLHRVSLYTYRLASSLCEDPELRGAVTPEFAEMLAIASVLHDIGKIAIEDSILFKPGPLTSAERARVRDHSVIGSKLLRDIHRRVGRSEVLRVAEQVARWHHERWDGAGDWVGLSGREIPLAARIVAIADVYEALSSPRDYKPAYPHDQCVQYIRDDAGKHFDPNLVAAFLRIEHVFREINSRYGESGRHGATPASPAAAEDGECRVGLASLCQTVKEFQEIASAAAQPSSNAHPFPSSQTTVTTGATTPWNA